MKHISSTIFVLLLTVSVFAQSTAHADSTKVKKTHSTKSAAPVKPVLAELVRSIESKMVLIEGGKFMMGCSNENDTACYYWEKPSHTVTVSNFYLSKFQVTQLEWETLVGDKPWFSKDCAECPVENVSWYDAQLFISKLNQLTGKFYRLPTEAEWEYAARGGNKSKGFVYAGDNNANNVAWNEKNSGKQSHPVGKKQANELGLYDMSGNVWQWCQDGFDEAYYSHSPADNPTGPVKSLHRVVRGGSWWSENDKCRVSNRDRYPADARDDDVGFRLARD
jgi:formylglycine-generating enzyme required for sulfatase activity